MLKTVGGFSKCSPMSPKNLKITKIFTQFVHNYVHKTILYETLQRKSQEKQQKTKHSLQFDGTESYETSAFPLICSTYFRATGRFYTLTYLNLYICTFAISNQSILYQSWYRIGTSKKKKHFTWVDDVVSCSVYQLVVELWRGGKQTDQPDWSGRAGQLP